MAQRQVVEIACMRCERKEYREPDPHDPVNAQDEEHRVPAFDATLYIAGEFTEIRFDDLCTPCCNTIKGHLGQISKKIEGNSPVRGKKEKKSEPAVVAAVNGTGGKEKSHARA